MACYISPSPLFSYLSPPSLSQTKAGNTALHMAYQQFHLPVIRILERQGADKLAVNDKGLTPAKMLYLKGKLDNKLRLACQFGDVSGAAFFIEKGADINSASKKTGATALMDACWAGNKEIVNLLMVCGADVSLKNNRKNTALHLAIQRGFSELIPILMKGLHADKAAKIKNYIGLQPEDLGRMVAGVNSTSCYPSVHPRRMHGHARCFGRHAVTTHGKHTHRHTHAQQQQKRCSSCLPLHCRAPCLA
jgi:hypothetical protein